MAEYTQQFLNDLIKQIGLGINISRTYPKGHPSLQPVVQRLRILLKEVPIEEETLSLVVIEDVIMIGEERFDSKRLPIVKSLVHRFGQLDVKSISFNVNVSEEDIKEFFSAMAATPADISDYGDIVALIRARGITGVQINMFRVGVISKEEEARAVNWDQFLDSLTTGGPVLSDEQRVKELGGFLAGVGVVGTEPVEVQTGKIVSGLEKLALMIADQYGEDRWNEYSIVFSRMLGALSPTIKKNITKYRTENKKLSVLFKSLIPSMTDEDIIDIISVKAKEKSVDMEQEIIDVLKNVTGSRLPGILSTLRINVPELDFEKIVARLMTEMKTIKGDKAADKFMAKNLETEMRNIFPQLRHDSQEERIKGINKLMEYVDRILENEKYDLMRLLIDRLDTMADAETEIATFHVIIGALKSLYLRCKEIKKDDLVQFISKKFGKHLLRKDVALIEKKKAILRCIGEIRDENYISELVSSLWDPGTFAEAREALMALAEYSVPLLTGILRETEDRAVRMKILDILVRIGEPALGEIEKLLDASEWYVRRNGIYLLGEMRVASAINKIVAFIDDSKEQVQSEVLASLKKIGGPEASEHIKKCLESKHRSVVIAAMRLLEPDDFVHKKGQLYSWLKSRKGIPDQKEERLRQEIIGLLGRIRDDDGIDILIAILNEKTIFKGDVLKPTKKAVLGALAEIGSDDALKALRDAARHKDDFISTSAADVLKHMESKTT